MRQRLHAQDLCHRATLTMSMAALLGCPATQDSGESPLVGTGATLVSLESFSCDAPETRSTAGAMEEWSLGTAWDAQPTADNLPWQYTGGGAAVADYNGDGRLDMYLPSAEDSLLLLSDGDVWRDGSAGLPTGESADLGIGGISFDADDDGDLDIYTLVLHGQNKLLINDGQGAFHDGTAAAGLSSGDWDTTHATAVDINNDGVLDLLVANHYEGPHLGEALLTGTFPPAHDSQLFLGDGQGGFVDATAQLPEAFRQGYSFAVHAADFDGDAQDELLSVNDFGPFAMPNMVLSGSGTQWNVNTALQGLDVAIYGMGVSSGDLNADLVPDVVMSSWGELVLLESAADGIWSRSAMARGLMLGAQQSTAWGVLLTDMDNDTDLDIPVAMGPLAMPEEFAEQIEGKHPGLQTFPDQPDALFLQQSDGTFTDVAPEWGTDHTGISRGMLAVDINRDGWLDLLRRGLDGPAVLYRARCGSSSGLLVELRQPAPNRYAIGAHILVEAQGNVQQHRRMRAGGEGHAMGGPPEVHFGIGTAEAVSLHITWPDGAVDVFDGVSPGHVRITRP